MLVSNQPARRLLYYFDGIRCTTEKKALEPQRTSGLHGFEMAPHMWELSNLTYSVKRNQRNNWPGFSERSEQNIIKEWMKNSKL